MHHTLNEDICFVLKSLARERMQVQQSQLSAAAHSCLFPSTESRLIDRIKKAKSGDRNNVDITRKDFSIAFDGIAEPGKNIVNHSTTIELSSFDRTLSLIAVDIAPYVRSIVAYDQHLQQQRAHLSSLLSEGGRSGKRMRTTRAAISALEGGARKTTRKDRYFGSAINPNLALRTGGHGWQEAAKIATAEMRGLSDQSTSDMGPVSSQE